MCLFQLKNATDKKPQTVKDPDVRSLFESSNPGRELAHQLGFEECSDGTIGTPVADDPAFNGAMRAVYVLWWTEDAGDSLCAIL